MRLPSELAVKSEKTESLNLKRVTMHSSIYKTEKNYPEALE